MEREGVLERLWDDNGLLLENEADILATDEVSAASRPGAGWRVNTLPNVYIYSGR